MVNTMAEWVTSKRAIPVFIVMAVAGMGIFIFSLAVLMLPYSNIIEESGGDDLTCLQVPFTMRTAERIITSYNSEARDAARRLHFPGDALFPLGYALLYSGLTGLVVRKQEGRWLTMGLVALFLPFGAMVLDWVENLHIVGMLNAFEADGIPAWMPLTGGLAGAFKYLLLSGLTPLYAIFAIARELRAVKYKLDKVTRAVYIAVVTLMAFNLYQPIAEVIPCIRW